MRSNAIKAARPPITVAVTHQSRLTMFSNLRESVVSIRGSARGLSAFSLIERALPRKQPTTQPRTRALCGVSDGSDFTLREGLYPSEPSAQRGLGLEERTQDEWTDEGGREVAPSREKIVDYTGEGAGAING